MKKLTPYILAAFFVLVGFSSSLAFNYVKDNTCENKYSFVNHRFSCVEKQTINKKGYSDLKARLISYIEEEKNKGKVDFIGIFFRDLEAGPTMGINDREDFIPASLLKLPLVLSFFDVAESNPDILNEMIRYEGDSGDLLNQTFIPKEPIERGKSYTIRELINHSLVDSDNVSSQLLYEYLLKLSVVKGEDILVGTYRDLGILETGQDFNKSAVTTKGYSAIFRLLYNASLLSPETSEKILNILSLSDFNKGLKGGVPDTVIVSHKFGERFLENGKKQLHDCGIIYYSNNPYSLCVMTRGNNFADLAEVISGVSKQVYEEFDSRRI